MARVRSPNYPALSLPEAINRVTTIHAAEQHLAAPKEVIAKHLGYGGLNGASIKVISAISKYGLLEEVGNDKVKVSPAALAILYPSKAEEKAAAIKEAALKPPLFAEIHSEWQGLQPSDENLRSYLIRKNFAADAVDRVIQSYRETMDLVAQDSGDYSPSDEVKKPEEKGSMQHQGRNNPPPAEGTPYRVSFTGDGIEVAARLKQPEDADELIRAINALKLLLRPTSEIKKPNEAD